MKYLALSALCFSNCSAADWNDTANTLSVEQVIELAPSLHGQQVTVRGWASMKPEDYGIWASADDYEKRNELRCITLLNYYRDRAKNEELHGSEVLVTGTVDSDVFKTDDGRAVIVFGCNKVGILFVEPDGLRQRQ